MATINSTAFLFSQQLSKVGFLDVVNSPESRIQKTTDCLSSAISVSKILILSWINLPHGDFFRGIT